MLGDALLGRSHRSVAGRARLAEVIERTRRVAEVPDDYLVGIVPGSDTGAMEMALWSLLGPRPVDVLSWESFGKGWADDIIGQLNLPEVRHLAADYGDLPDLDAVDGSHDIVFPWNGTTSGVIVPDGEWIPSERDGLVLCDATSAVMAVALPWERLDVVTWSWQKLLGGEAAHGVLVLSPRAVDRLHTHTPTWPVPKLFRLTHGGELIAGIFRGDTINTPSMLCVEDALDALRWAGGVGGANGMRRRTAANFAAIGRWVAATDWVEFLATKPNTRSPTSVCLRIVAPWFRALSGDEQSATAKRLVKRLDEEGVAYDIGSYRDAPPGLRIWAGATVETKDIEALLPWLGWAFAETAAEAST